MEVYQLLSIIYPLHNRLDYKTTVEFLKLLGIIGNSNNDLAYRKYMIEICKCPVCKKILKHSMDDFKIFQNTLFYNVVIHGYKQGRPYASQETKEVCVLNYLFNKVKEFKQVKKKSVVEVIRDLKSNFNLYKSMDIIELGELFYMQNWATTINSLYKRNAGNNYE